MLYLYISCLAFGGIFIVLSLISGDTDVDGDFKIEGELNVDGDVESFEETNVSETLKFFSFRNIIYFLTFFGLSGTIFTLFNFNIIITIISSFILGFFSGYTGYKLMSYLKSTESGKVENLKQFEGLYAKVIIDISKNVSGKISVNKGDGYITLVALAADESSIDKFFANDKVIIVRFENGKAYVAEENFV